MLHTHKQMTLGATLPREEILDILLFFQITNLITEQIIAILRLEMILYPKLTKQTGQCIIYWILVTIQGVNIQ